jgi:hypothetical protein
MGVGAIRRGHRADLADITQADEQAALDAGQIRASGIWYAGRRR